MVRFGRWGDFLDEPSPLPHLDELADFGGVIGEAEIGIGFKHGECVRIVSAENTRMGCHPRCSVGRADGQFGLRSGPCCATLWLAMPRRAAVPV